MDSTVSSFDSVRSVLVVHEAGAKEVCLVGFGGEARRETLEGVGKRREEWGGRDHGFVRWKWVEQGEGEVSFDDA